MSKQFLLITLFSLVLGLAGTVRAEEAASTPTPPAAECPHMKAMKEGKAGGECPHMKDGKPCDCPHCKGLKEGKEGGGCPHMKDGKPCDCPHGKAELAPKGDKPGKQAAKESKPGKKGSKAASDAEPKAAKE